MSTQHTLGAQFPPAFHRPFLRYIEGEAGGGTPTDPPAGDPPAQDPPAQDPPAPGPAEEDASTLPDWARKSLTKANNEAAAARVAAKDAKDSAAQREKELVQSIGKALGLVKDDDTPSVESLTTALQERDSTLSTTTAALAAQRAENAVLRYAAKHNGDPDALLDSRDFEKKLAEIDSTATDYASLVEDLVKTEIESNNRYRKVQVTPQSGDGTPPPSGDPQKGQLTREQLAALSPEERLKAAKEGRISGLLGNKK